MMGAGLARGVSSISRSFTRRSVRIRRGYRVSAFDYSATAIDSCQRRFPESTVQYRVADLFDRPADWARRFEVVVEINTIQSLPPDVWTATIQAIAGTVAPGAQGVRGCLDRADDEQIPQGRRAVSRRDLRTFAAAGLCETAFTEGVGPPGRPNFLLAYERLTLSARRPPLPVRHRADSRDPDIRSPRGEAAKA